MRTVWGVRWCRRRTSPAAASRARRCLPSTGGLASLPRSRTAEVSQDSPRVQPKVPLIPSEAARTCEIRLFCLTTRNQEENA